MNDRTITRAARQGARTVPVERKPHPPTIRGNVTLTPDELELAMEMARSDRLEQSLRDYAHRKRTS